MMPIPQFLEMVGVLLVAAALGALIGFERERADHPAGLRTHILVCVGSALFTLASVRLAAGTADPTRIAAQIVSGIGFLGAGTILHHGNIVRGLTTAASLWVVAGIGMAVATGGEMLMLAVVASLLVFFTLTFLKGFGETRIAPIGFRGVTITMQADRDAVGELLLGLAEQGIEVRRAAISPALEGDQFQVQILMRPPRGLAAQDLSGWMARHRGVIGIDWA